MTEAVRPLNRTSVLRQVVPETGQRQTGYGCSVEFWEREVGGLLAADVAFSVADACGAKFVIG
jgi:hypothetical protein